MVAHSKKDGSGDAAVYMLPSASPDSLDFNTFEDKVPEKVLKYCLSAQDVYHSGNLTAANVLIQAAMSAIFNDLLPSGNSKSSLAQMIQSSSTSLNLNKPLTRLSEDIGNGGNLDTLFQHHEDTSQQTADTMMALLESLLAYLYVVPDRLDELQEQFEKINLTHKLSRMESELTSKAPEIDEGENNIANLYDKAS
ncbi:MAG: hypothetical protein AB8B63_24125 [Granulosicoccus sp.]